MIFCEKRIAAALALILFTFTGFSTAAETVRLPTEGSQSHDSNYATAYASSCIWPYASAQLINVTNSFISIKSPSAAKISMEANIYTYNTVEKIGFISLTLQEWTDSGWIDLYSYKDRYSNNEDSFSFQKSETIGISSGNYYRLTAELHAKDGTLTDTKTYTTDYIVAR